MSTYHYHLLFLSNEDLITNQATHLHINRENGTHELLVSAVRINADGNALRGLGLKVLEQAETGTPVVVTIYNQDKRRAANCERDLTEFVERRNVKSADDAPSLFAWLARHAGDVYGGRRRLDIIVEWTDN